MARLAGSEELSPLLLAQENNVFLIDWLTVVFHDVSVPLVQALLGLGSPDIPWETETKFRNGYPCRTFYKHISILWGADDPKHYSSQDKARSDMGICLDISGQGCREFENVPGNDWVKFLVSIADRDLRTSITRLDLAYDDHTGLLDLGQIANDVRDRYYTSPSRKSQIIWSDDQDHDTQGLTVYVGSKSSDVMIRIYDKAAEREFQKDERHWVRVELQLRHDRCTVAVAEIIKQQHVGRTACGILRNYLLFRQPSGTDDNKSRWPVAPYWDRLLLDMSRISLWISPGEPYNFSKTELHMMRQYGQALITKLRIDGSLGPFVTACERLYPVLNKKYQRVLDDHERIRADAQLEHEQLRIEHRGLIDQHGRLHEWWYEASLLPELPMEVDNE